jgi:hypothetical protein
MDQSHPKQEKMYPVHVHSMNFPAMRIHADVPERSHHVITGIDESIQHPRFGKYLEGRDLYQGTETMITKNPNLMACEPRILPTYQTDPETFLKRDPRLNTLPMREGVTLATPRSFQQIVKKGFPTKVDLHEELEKTANFTQPKMVSHKKKDKKRALKHPQPELDGGKAHGKQTMHVMTKVERQSKRPKKSKKFPERPVQDDVGQNKVQISDFTSKHRPRSKQEMSKRRRFMDHFVHHQNNPGIISEPQHVRRGKVPSKPKKGEQPYGRVLKREVLVQPEPITVHGPARSCKKFTAKKYLKKILEPLGLFIHPGTGGHLQ